MINYYEYETSPRKEETEEPLPRRTRKKENAIHNKEDIRKKIRKAQAIEKKRNVKHILEIGVVFVLLLTISYRYALINSRFTQKENLKSSLAELQKQNAQLKVSIEQGMNINNIEQAAKEKLGMQKLDNNQKVYITLQKKDYVESSINSENETEENWWQKLLKTLKGE